MNTDPERLKAAQARIIELETQLAAVKLEAERRGTAEAQMRARAAQRATQARAEAAEALRILALKEAQSLAWIQPPIVRRTVEVAKWIVIGQLTAKLQQRSIDTIRGSLRAGAYYVIKGSMKPIKIAQLPVSFAWSETSGEMLELDSSQTTLRLVYISAEPESAGHTYRVLRYVDSARAIGAHASWMRTEEIAQKFKEIAQANIVFIWRAPWDSEIEFAVEVARRSGAKVVFDIDDLLIDPDVARTEVIAGIADSGYSEEGFREQCARWQRTLTAADYCTVPTDELAQHVRRLGTPALVLPNGFDSGTYLKSRRCARQRRHENPDGLIRIGYPGGTPTHRRDLAMAAQGLAQVLSERPQCRLVLFRFSDPIKMKSLDLKQLGVFEGVEDRIEWRDIVPIAELPVELARFDINIAPLEVGNVFCEAKSELKFFDAALLDIPTIASATGPYRRAIRDGETGFLASSSREWHSRLLQLVDDDELRYRLGRAAHRDVLGRFGALRRSEIFSAALPQLLGDGRSAAQAFALGLQRSAPELPSISIARSDIIFESDRFGEVEATVVLLSSDAPAIEQVLASIADQTIQSLDLLVIGDAADGPTASTTGDWARRQASRFNRVILVRMPKGAVVGATWNAAIDAADTPFVLLLPAGFGLAPECVAACLTAAQESGAAFTYPRIRNQGDAPGSKGTDPFDMGRLVNGGEHHNAPLLVWKEAWAAVGGYSDTPSESEVSKFCYRLIRSGRGGRVAGDAALAAML